MLNNVALMGRLVEDPKLRTTTSNISVTTFTIAVNRDYVAKGAERETDFIEIVAWRGTADFICKHFHKGQMIALYGTIQTRTYTDKEGKNRKVFEVVAGSAYFCGDNKRPSGDVFVDDTQADYDGFQSIADDDDLPF